MFKYYGKINIGRLLHVINILIRFSFIFKTICSTPAVHLFFNLWMPHHKSTYCQHKVLHSNAPSKKKEKENYLENGIREKIRKVLLLTVQSPPSDKITARAVRSRYQSRAPRLIWYLRMDVKYAAIKAPPTSGAADISK